MNYKSLNKAILIGRLGQDPEIRYTNSGDPVASMSLATTQKWKDKKGEYQDKTEWHKLVAFGQKGDFVKNYLSKGAFILIEGHLQTRSWEDKNGNKRYTTQVVVDNITPLDNKSDSRNEQDNSDEEDDMPF